MIDLSDLTPFTTLGIIAFIVLIIYLIVLLVEMFRDYIRHVEAKKINKKYENPPAPPSKEYEIQNFFDIDELKQFIKDEADNIRKQSNLNTLISIEKIENLLYKYEQNHVKLVSVWELIQNIKNDLKK